MLSNASKTISTVGLCLALAVPATTAFAQQAKHEPEASSSQKSSHDKPMTKAGEDVSDAWITTKVKADLLATDGVAGTDIDVDTRDGVVTLNGRVKTQAEADKAVDIAKAIKGVSKVNSNLSASNK